MEYYYRLPVSNHTKIIILSNLGLELSYLKNFSHHRVAILLGETQFILGDSDHPSVCIKHRESTYCFQTIRSEKKNILFSVYVISLFPTGITEVDSRIMTFLPDEQLLAVCYSNKRLLGICNNDEFWRLKLSEYLNIELPRKNYEYAKMGKKLILEYQDWRIEWGIDRFEMFFIIVAGFGYLDLLKLLADHGVDVRAAEDQALIQASAGGFVDVMEWLLKEGADVSTLDEDPLLMAIRNNRPAAVKLLLDNGAVIQGSFVKTASKNGYTEVVSILFDYDAARHYNINEALDDAVEGGIKNLDTIVELLKRGATVVNDQYNVLNTAVEIGDLELARFLIERGANGNMISHTLLTAAEDGNKEMVKLLLGTGINIVDAGKALVRAAEKNQVKIIELLISKVNLSRAVVNRAFDTAVADCKLRSAKILLEHGADLHYDDDRPLFIARTKCTKILRFLLEEGANVHARDDTILDPYGAISEENIKLLIEYGVGAQALKKARPGEKKPKPRTLAKYDLIVRELAKKGVV